MSEPVWSIPTRQYEVQVEITRVDYSGLRVEEVDLGFLTTFTLVDEEPRSKEGRCPWLPEMDVGQDRTFPPTPY